MKHYSYKFNSNLSDIKKKDYTVVGTVSSGNLEVMVEIGKVTDNETCFDIYTTADGFKDTWKAVLKDIADNFEVGGLSFSINDFGAVPAVVSLRLRQAVEEINLQ